MKNRFGLTALSSVMAFTATMALADGKVTVYTAVPQNFIDALVPVFESDTGTSVEIIKAGSGELLNRLEAEKETNVFTWIHNKNARETNGSFTTESTKLSSDK